MVRFGKWWCAWSASSPVFPWPNDETLCPDDPWKVAYLKLYPLHRTPELINPTVGRGWSLGFFWNDSFNCLCFDNSRQIRSQLMRHAWFKLHKHQQHNVQRPRHTRKQQFTWTNVYTPCLKKGFCQTLALPLSNLNRFSKIFHCWIKNEIVNKTLQYFPPIVFATLHYETQDSTFVTKQGKIH